jgi:hypothetical protein
MTASLLLLISATLGRSVRRAWPLRRAMMKACIVECAFVLLLVSVCAQGQTQFPRHYYLTTKSFTTLEAPTACSPGYHMASFAELANPSTLIYESKLGLTLADSGSGPPVAQFSNMPVSLPVAAHGWIRTGSGASLGQYSGIHNAPGNCNAWTSTSGSGARGTTAALTVNKQPGNPGSTDLQFLADLVWFIDFNWCQNSERVWCISD